MPELQYPEDDIECGASEDEIDRLLASTEHDHLIFVKSEVSEHDLMSTTQLASSSSTERLISRDPKARSQISSTLKRERSEDGGVDFSSRDSNDVQPGSTKTSRGKRNCTVGVRYDVDSLEEVTPLRDSRGVYKRSVDVIERTVDQVGGRNSLKHLEDMDIKFKKPKFAGPSFDAIRAEVLQSVPTFLVHLSKSEKSSSEQLSLEAEWKRYMLVWAFGFSLVTTYGDGWLTPSPDSIVQGIFLTPAWNPCLPMRVGEPGIWHSPHRFSENALSLFTMDKKSLWHYKGEYNLSPLRKLTSEEWRSMDREVRDKWIHGLFWEGFNHKRAEIRLCRGGNMPTDDEIEASVQEEGIRLLALSAQQRKTYQDRCIALQLNLETIEHSFDHGNVNLWLILMTCFDYKHDFLALLHRTRRKWIAAGEPKRTRADIADAKLQARLQSATQLPKKEEPDKKEGPDIKLTQSKTQPSDKSKENEKVLADVKPNANTFGLLLNVDSLDET